MIINQQKPYSKIVPGQKKDKLSERNTQQDPKRIPTLPNEREEI